jgi:SAM-dependent methyltransferase
MEDIVKQLVYIRENYAPQFSYSANERSSKYTINTVKNFGQILKKVSVNGISVFDPVISAKPEKIDFSKANRALLILSGINDFTMEVIKELFDSGKIALLIYAIDNFMESPEIAIEFDEDKYIVMSDLQNFPNFVVVRPKLVVRNTYNFRDLLHSRDTSFIWRLEQLASKGMQFAVVRQLVRNLVKAGKDDEQIYQALRSAYHAQTHEVWQGNRGKQKARELMSYLPQGFRPRNFLDAGCGEGAITAEFGSELGLTPENIHGYDIRDIPENTEYTFRLLDVKNDNPVNLYKDVLETGGFDIIAAQMCLHHIEPEFMSNVLADIRKLLAPGGLFIIREHDCEGPNMHKLLDIYHGMYAIVWPEKQEMLNFSSTYEAYYHSKQFWEDTIIKAGFKLANSGNYIRPMFSRGKMPNPYQIYICLFLG